MEGTITAVARPKGRVVRLPDAASDIQRVYAQDYARLCAAACAILHDEHLAQDAVQEAWHRLSDPRTLAGLATDDAEKLRHLVLVTVRHAALNLRRGNAKTQPAPDERFAAQPDPGPAPAERAEQNDAVRALKAALQQLEETDRAIVLLQYDHGCTGRQIAALLGLREAAVRKRSQRAKERLRKILTEGGVYHNEKR